MSILFAKAKISDAVSHYEDEHYGFHPPMGQVGQRQFTMSLLVLALVFAGFTLFNLFHFIVA